MPLVELRHISKRFGPVIALDDVSISLAPGKIHALLGENGAGKSTAMNILYGLLRPDSGQIGIDQQARRPFRSPRDAIAAGIGMVHQHFMLAGALTVLDNILLGDQRQGVLLDRAAARRRLAQFSEQSSLPIHPDARVDDLSVGQQQRVEILKALWRDVKLLILDEPTAVLTPPETQQLFVAMRKLRDQGTAIVFISHKLGEVREICDELTILRKGRVVWRGSPADASEAQLAREMVGRDVADVSLVRGSPVGGEAPILQVQSLTAKGLSEISFTIGREILGIAGVDGNGQQELAEVLVGLRKLSSGRIVLAGQEITTLSLEERTRLGLAHIPNDRKREGLVVTMSIAQNLAIKRHRQPPFSRAGILAETATRKVAIQLVDRFDVRAPTIDTPISSLSGGNQQKVLLARELGIAPPKFVVAMNPTRGLDIAATNFVYQQLLAFRAAGCAILLISSELDELLRLCDRIGVLFRGRLTITNFPIEDEGRIGQLMAGV